VTVFCQDNPIAEIRSCFLKAENIDDIENLIEISNNHRNHPVVYAYNCTGKLMLLDKKENPIDKWIIFTNETNKLDSIISNNPMNIEIRMLRFAIQKNAPSFLLYNKNMINDSNMIILNLPQQSNFLQDYIKSIINSL
tara:strand:+ start:538 stop:951 length:414 start_codon:yes stop_codon:yes gene_type:complete